MKQKSRILGILVVLVVAVGLVACNAKKSEKVVETKGHASLTEQQKLIACADCHKQATPEIFSQWYDSTHGIGNVKCYQCHNTFENLLRSPDINQSCNSCHSDKVTDNDHTQGMATCWECHQVHSFSAE